VLLSCALIELDGVPAVVWSWRDVTDLRRARDALQELNASLERRVAERTRELEGANREMESFSYTISHDLRAPVRAMASFAQLLRTRHAAALPADAAKLLLRVEENARHMSRLIADLLEFSRAGRAALEPAEVDMAALAGQVAEELAAGASPRPEIRIGTLPVARGDASLLRQVWSNLIGNAVKFSRHAGAPRIEIGGRLAGGAAEYHVADNGVGVDAEYADKLFGGVQRLHSTDEFAGSGVGLAIVQRIVEKHGGSVSAESAGRGATFRFSLPAG
jgi:light-regulated signal transduction histidine kinase (bacteriophytochrome)